MFHAGGLATVKVPSHNVQRRIAGSTRSAEDAERRRRHGHRRSQGVQPTQRGEKKFRRNLQGKCVSKSQFLGQFLLGGLDLEVYFRVRI